MRILCCLLAVLMALFAGVQINDPDGLKWMVIYCIPGVLALIAAVRPSWYQSAALRAVLLAFLFLAILGTAYYWPKSDAWWTKDVWWEVETAREGMGMMIIVVVLVLVFIAQRQLRKRLVN